MRTIRSRELRLPYLGKELFLQLCTGTERPMNYKSEGRTFVIRDDANLSLLKDALTRALKEEIKFELEECPICGTMFSCEDCSFLPSCGDSDRPDYCICERCLSDPKCYEKYVEAWDRRFER